MDNINNINNINNNRIIYIYIKYQDSIVYSWGLNINDNFFTRIMKSTLNKNLEQFV